MSATDVVAHVVVTVALLVLSLGVPAAFARVSIAALLGVGAGPSLVSSATVIADAPSGAYTILINANRHDPALLATWVDFFEGEDVPLIMEDVSAVALSGDAAGVEMAESLQSRLAENQMRLRTEQAALALSKVEAGAFDVVIMSDEAADAVGAATAFGLPNVVVVRR